MEWVGDKKGVGIVVGIVNEGESRIVSCGTKNKSSNAAVDRDTVFEIGSVSKVFTSLLLTDMVQRGEVDFNTPVATLLPSKVKVPRKDGQQITVSHLATHTSGLPGMPSNWSPNDWDNPYADYSIRELYQTLSNCSLANSIGGHYEYSNIGVGLLGHALAFLAGKDYEALVLERICHPLKMRSTRIHLTGALQRRLAAPHDACGNQTTNWDIPTLAGTGALRSTASYLLKFAMANLSLVQTPLTEAMEKTHLPRAKTSSPDLEVCLGWHLLKQYGREILWHNGETGGYHSFVGLDKQRRVGVVVLANFTARIDGIGFHLIDERFDGKPPNPGTS